MFDRCRLPGRALAALALVARLVGAEDEPQALVMGKSLIDKFEHGDASVISSLGNLIATAPEPIALQLLALMAQATDDVGFQVAAIEGLHNLAPEVRRAAIITVAILGRAKSPYGTAIRQELHESEFPRLLRAAEDYAGFVHDDLAIPDLMSLIDTAKDADVVDGAHQALAKIAGKDVGTRSLDWNAWYQERTKAIDEMVQAVRAAYGRHDKLKEIQAVRALISVTDLPSIALDALADLSKNDPDAEIRETAGKGIGGLQCAARFEYEAGTYTGAATVFDNGAPIAAPVNAETVTLAAPAAPAEKSSSLGWIIAGALALLATVAWIFRPRSQQPQARPAAMLIRHQAARPSPRTPQAPARPAPAAGSGAKGGA